MEQHVITLSGDITALVYEVSRENSVIKVGYIVYTAAYICP